MYDVNSYRFILLFLLLFFIVSLYLEEKNIVII